MIMEITERTQRVFEAVKADSVVSIISAVGLGMLPVLMIAQMGIPSIVNICAAVALMTVVVVIARIIYLIVKGNPARNKNQSYGVLKILKEMFPAYVTILTGLLIIVYGDTKFGLGAIGIGVAIAVIDILTVRILPRINAKK